MAKKPFYISFDNVKLVDGDNFHYLFKNSNGTYDIKYWNCSWMEDFNANKLYLKDKIKFVNLEIMREYVIENCLVVNNFNKIFSKQLKAFI